MKAAPIDSTNLEKIDFYKNKNDIDPNHTKEKIEQIKEEQPDDEMPDGNQITINPISVEITTVVNNDNEDKDQKKKKDRTTSAGSSKGFIEALNVYFDSDDATLSNSYNEQIIKLVNRYDFSDGSTYQIIIVGHTDNDGEENYNLILSKKRAETVRRKLETFGAKYDQIEVYYYGEWKPLKDNNNEEQKGFNRRVEIQVLEK